MQFDVPQFIESETRIAGFLTFRQVLYLTAAGIIIMVSYFSLAKTAPVIFTIITILAILLGSSFAFLKVGGFNLNVFLRNLVSFLMSSKVYLWHKPEISPKVIERKIVSVVEKKEEKTLKIGGASRINKLYSQIETGSQG